MGAIRIMYIIFLRRTAAAHRYTQGTGKVQALGSGIPPVLTPGFERAGADAGAVVAVPIRGSKK